MATGAPEAPEGRAKTSASEPRRTASMHTVDWSTLQQIRAELVKTHDSKTERTITFEELTSCWLRVAEAELRRSSEGESGAMSQRDRDFIHIRVSQSMREVDPQCLGLVEVDVWVHHMLLTRSSPSAMRAMLQINRLLEAALQICPGILVALQSALEVASTFPEPLPSCVEASGHLRGRELSSCASGAQPRDFSQAEEEPEPEERAEGASPSGLPEESLRGGGGPAGPASASASSRARPAALPSWKQNFESSAPSKPLLAEPRELLFSEVVGIYGRKLWHLRPGKESISKRRSDFSYATPDEFVRNVVKAMELDGGKVTSADFLALCLGRREWQVTLHLYDLSKGVARALSPWLLHERLEGVWHTGLVVYGKEYYFGGDIFYDAPGETGFGVPRIAIHLGATLRQRDELHAFIVDELKPVFTREAYDAARNNCNHFTDRLSMYLVGKHIPEEVLAQPELMMQTALGRFLRPILTKALGTHGGLLPAPRTTAEEISLSSSAWEQLHATQKGALQDGGGAAHVMVENQASGNIFAL